MTHSAGAWFCPTRRSTIWRPTMRSARNRSGRISPIGMTSRYLVKDTKTAVQRSRLLRDRPQETASAAAGARPRTRRRIEIRDRSRPAPETTARTTIWSSPRRSELQDPHALPTRSSRTSISANASFVWLGTIRNSDAFTFIFEETDTAGFGRTPISLTMTRRRSSLNACRKPSKPLVSLT
jgi:hypothetical protein